MTITDYIIIAILGFIFLAFLYATVEQTIKFRRLDMPKEYTANKFSRPPGVGKTVDHDHRIKNLHNQMVFWKTELRKTIRKNQTT